MTEGLLGEPTAVRVSADDPEPLVEAARRGGVPVAAVGPTGATGLEPLVMATLGGRTVFHAGCSPERAAEVAERLADGELGEADAVAEHDPRPKRLPVPDEGPLGVGVRDALGRPGWVRPTSAEDHAASGGFVEVDPDAAIDRVRGLHGRGWGDGATDAPVAGLWERVRGGDDPAVVVNAHGPPADRLLLEGAPLAVLDGTAVAARAVGADEAVIYVPEGWGTARGRVEEAADVPGIGGEVDVRVVAAPDDHMAGEPTMALEAIEGSDRLEARLRPPGPEEVGLYGRPTLVHTPRTLAQVAASTTREREPTRLVTVTGDVEARATVELPSGAALSTAMDAVAVEGSFKAACVGGRFGGLARDLDVPATAEGLSGADLGTEGVVEVLNGGRCAVAFAGERSRFAAEGNCGRCVPCREGSKQLAELLREVYAGSHRPAAIRELARVMASTSLCGFGEEAPRPARTALSAFAEEFEAHAAGECPAGACEMEVAA